MSQGANKCQKLLKFRANVRVQTDFPIWWSEDNFGETDDKFKIIITIESSLYIVHQNYFTFTF